MNETSQIPAQDQAVSKKKPVFLLILSLFFFPPLFLYLVWKENSFHGFFAKLSSSFGASLVIFGANFLIFYLDKFNKILAESVSDSVQFDSRLVWLVIIIGLLQMTFGYIGARQAKLLGRLPAFYLWILIILMIISLVLPLVLYSQLMSSIYDSILS